MARAEPASPLERVAPSFDLDLHDPSAAPRARARLSGHLAWNLGADLAARGASLWLSFFCARHLDIADFGRFSFALAAAQYAWLVGDAALNGGYATRETARDRPRTPGQTELFWTARLGAAGIVTALFLVVVALVPAAPATRDAMAAVSVFFFAYAAFPDWALRGAEDFAGLALGNLVYALALIGVTAALLPAHPSPALAAGAWAGCFALAALVTLPRLARRGVLTPGLRFSAAAWWPHFRRSSVFSLGSIAAIGGMQVPLLLGGVLAGAHEIGLYSAGFRLLVAFIGALTILWWPLMPVLARERPDSPVFRDVLASAAATVVGVSVPVALALTCFPADVLRLLFGGRYEAGAAALAIGAWALPLYSLTGLAEQTGLALGSERMRATVAWISLAAIAVLAFALIPRFGAAGAAAASVAGFAIALAQYAFRLRGVVRFGELAGPLARVGAATLALAAFWMVTPRFVTLPALVWIALGTGLYSIVALRFRLLPLAPPLPRWRRAR